MPFKKGQGRMGGRAKGVLDRRLNVARLGAEQAVRMLSEQGCNPIIFQREINRLMHDVAIMMAAGQNQDAQTNSEKLAEYIAGLAMPSTDPETGQLRQPNLAKSRLILEWLKEARDGWYKLTQFVYPKLSSVDIRDPLLREHFGLVNRNEDAALTISREEIVMQLKKRGVNIDKVLDIDVDEDADDDEDDEGEALRGASGNGRGPF
jgi:hypothetical protein